MALSLLPSALSFTAPATAFRSGSPSMSVLKGQPFCKGLPGAISPLGEFDPLGFSNDVDVLEVNRLREAELAHGRVGMLAAAGFLVQEKFHPLFGGSITGPAINHIPQIPPFFWGVLVAGIGAAESYRINVGYANPQEAIAVDDPNTPENESSGWNSANSFSLKESYTPGTLGFDPLGLAPEDPEEFALMQEKELSHCRLAMIAASGFLAQEAVSGQTWGTWWGDATF